MEYAQENFCIRSMDYKNNAAFYELVDRNRKRIENYFPGTTSAMETKQKATNYMKELHQKHIDRQFFSFILYDLSDRYIGYIDVKHIDWRVPKAEVGYFIDHAFEGQGIISDALIAITDHLNKKHGFLKFVSRMAFDNIGSSRVAEKAGFEFEGLMKKDFRLKDGRLMDHKYYGKVYSK